MDLRDWGVLSAIILLAVTLGWPYLKGGFCDV
jgi:hypothetical protein